MVQPPAEKPLDNPLSGLWLERWPLEGRGKVAAPNLNCLVTKNRGTKPFLGSGDSMPAWGQLPPLQPLFILPGKKYNHPHHTAGCSSPWGPAGHTQQEAFAKPGFEAESKVLAFWYFLVIPPPHPQAPEKMLIYITAVLQNPLAFSH